MICNWKCPNVWLIERKKKSKLKLNIEKEKNTKIIDWIYWFTDLAGCFDIEMVKIVQSSAAVVLPAQLIIFYVCIETRPNEKKKKAISCRFDYSPGRMSWLPNYYQKYDTEGIFGLIYRNSLNNALIK